LTEAAVELVELTRLTRVGEEEGKEVGGGREAKSVAVPVELETRKTSEQDASREDAEMKTRRGKGRWG